MDDSPLSTERLADLEHRCRADFVKALRQEYGRHHAPSGDLIDELWAVVEHHFGPIFDDISIEIMKAVHPHD